MSAALVAPSSLANSPKTNAIEPACGIRGVDEPKYIPIPTQADATEGVLSMPGGAGLYYWDTGGTGPAILLCHPGRGSALSWPYQQPFFAAKGIRTIAYSRRGHYRSPAGAADQAGTYADDVNALLNHLNVDKVHILGLAAGGVTVSDFVVSFPHKVLSMTIVCSLFGLWDKDIDERSDFILPKEYRDLPPDFKELGPSYRWANPQGVKAWLEMEKASRGDGSRVRQKAKSKVTWDKLRQLKLPTFFITGGADLYQPPSMMRAAAREIPWSETLVVPEAGHALQWEQPNVFNRVVLDFIQRNS